MVFNEKFYKQWGEWNLVYQRFAVNYKTFQQKMKSLGWKEKFHFLISLLCF